MDILTNAYGQFSSDGSRFTITTPRTPDTWFNYLFNDDYYMRVSQTAQGGSWIRKPTIRMYNRGYRFFYIYDEQTKDCWNVNYAPLKIEPDRYACTHALGWTEIQSARGDIETRLRVFVPTEGMHEIWTVSITNIGRSSRRLSLYSVFSLETIGVMGSKCRLDSDTGILAAYAFPHHAYYEQAETLKNSNNHAFVFANVPADSYDCSELRFFGSDDVTALPVAIQRGGCSGLISEGHKPTGSLQHRLDLLPGESVCISMVTGCAGNMEQVAACKARYANQEAVEASLQDVEDYWNELTHRLLIRTPDANLDSFLNYWLKKQIVWETRTRRNGISTPCRNELQDAMGYSVFDPDAAWKFMEASVSLQNADGYVHVWNTVPGHKTGPLEKLVHNDGPIWMIICLCAFLDQSGDAGYLDREIPFKDEGSANLYEHLARAIEYQIGELGSHGLCLMRDGDWTDPINGPGRGGKGESVWATMALKYAIDRFLPYCLCRDDTERAERFQHLAEKLDEAVNRHAWTGQWYCYGFDDDGKPFGTPEDHQGRIYLNTQTWAIISGIARSERLNGCLRAIEKLNTPCGPRLLWPPFTEWNDTVGRLSVKLAGATENGAVYCHGSMFKVFADCLRGDGNAAYETIRRTLPTNPDNPPEKSLQAPIFVANSYFGLPESPNFGQSSQNLGTGTGTWLMHSAVNYLVGIRATTEGLQVCPCLPDDWQEVTVKRTFRKARYVIHIRRELSQARQTPRIAVNNQPWRKPFLPYKAGSTFHVEVTCYINSNKLMC